MRTHVGPTFAQLVNDRRIEGGKITGAWAAVEKDLIERARKSITLGKMD